MDTKTKGNVVVESIKIGDTHYEYEMGMGIKVEVISLPVRREDGLWEWQSRDFKTGNVINYAVREGHSHYAPNLYDYPAYGLGRVEQ